METMVERCAEMRRELEEALEEREIAQERFEAAIGTSTEMRAYQRFRRATRRLSAAGADLDETMNLLAGSEETSLG